MEQQIRFCEVGGRRVAFAEAGSGPPLVFGATWVSHLEDDWADPRARSFYEHFASAYRVIRYDRPGAGLSDRELDGTPTIESETAALEGVLEASGCGPATFFAGSCGAVPVVGLAAARPELVQKIVFCGAYVSRHDVPDATRRSLVDFARVNWPLVAQMLAGLMAPHASGDEIEAHSRYKRHAADGEAAAAFLELDLTVDLRPLLPLVTMPALVLHRRGDRTVPVKHGRELASLLPNARFVPLSGDAHPPWLDDQRELQRALAGFLYDAPTPRLDGDSPLTSRETEVLRLVASGLTNREIASSLVLSEHTVHRHVANVLRKLSEPSRAAAAAKAARAGIV